MVRHVALFRWHAGTPAEAIAEAKRRLDALPGRIPEIRSLACGPDVGGADGHWDFAVAADFDDLESYRIYATHPDHLAAVSEAIVPHRADRAVLQYQLD
jgi:hypothetical protein